MKLALLHFLDAFEHAAVGAHLLLVNLVAEGHGGIEGGRVHHHDASRAVAREVQGLARVAEILDEGVLVPVEFGQWLDLRHSNLLIICCKYTVNKQN